MPYNQLNMIKSDIFADIFVSRICGHKVCKLKIIKFDGEAHVYVPNVVCRAVPLKRPYLGLTETSHRVSRYT